MVHGTEEWSETNTKVKEKKTTTSSTKNVREGKGAGSRRIFSPVFKLQVLDSYRQDSDCQGNQRATARKYGIHRRQIQKWLQMETNLRLSVQQQQQQQQQQSNTTTALNLSSGNGGRHSDDNESLATAIATVLGNETKKTSPRSSSPKDTTQDSKPKLDDSTSASDTEEYVNVDEITDTEDDDEDETSSCSSYEKCDRALDFTSATLSKRKFYTSDFKLHVLDAFKNDKTCQGNQRATARKFGIHRRQVQKWLNRESLIKAAQSCGNSCLDLSHKRKLDEMERIDVSTAVTTTTTATTTTTTAISLPPKKLKVLRNDDEVQESALCLVKNKIEPVDGNYHRLYPAGALEHSYNSSLSCIGPEYPLCVYQPWNCCYQQISSVGSTFESMIPKYSYSFNFKCETSYVDFPVQYGFGDSVPSKWMKANPLYIPEPPTIQVLSSYR